MDVDDDARTIGARLRQIRHARRKSLRVVAGLAGMSKSRLSEIERGESALDRRSESVAVANVLQIALSELVKLPVPAPGNGDTDSALVAVRQALTAASRNRPGGQVLPIDALRIRVWDLLVALRQCRLAEIGAVLPVLIRDLHTSIATGRDVAELLDLAVVLHTQDSLSWLRVMGAGVDLCSLTTVLTRQAAERRDEPTMMGLAVFGDGLVLLAGGDFKLARVELDSVSVPTNSPESMRLEGMLALCRSLVVAADRRPADVDAALGYASELAEHTGEGNAYSMGFGPTNVGLWLPTAADAAPAPDQRSVPDLDSRISEGFSCRSAACVRRHRRQAQRDRQRQDALPAAGLSSDSCA